MWLILWEQVTYSLNICRQIMFYCRCNFHPRLAWRSMLLKWHGPIHRVPGTNRNCWAVSSRKKMMYELFPDALNSTLRPARCVRPSLWWSWSSSPSSSWPPCSPSSSTPTATTRAGPSRSSCAVASLLGGRLATAQTAGASPASSTRSSGWRCNAPASYQKNK